MTIHKLQLGMLFTNCYLVGDPETGDAVVIDPADSAPLILKAAQDAGWTIRRILATHGHFDHIMGSAELKELTGAPFYVHEADLPLVRDMQQNVRLWLGMLGMNTRPAAEPDGFVQAGETIPVGGIALEVLFTPGHTPGSVSYVLRREQIVFCGDALFRESIGRTDLPGGDYDTLMRSITTHLLPLGDTFTVEPGHMENTTIGYERQHNVYLLDYLHK